MHTNPYKSPTTDLIRPPNREPIRCQISIRWLLLAFVGIGTSCFGWLLADSLLIERSSEAAAVLVFAYIGISPAIVIWFGLDILQFKGVPALLAGIFISSALLVIRSERVEIWFILWPVLLLVSLPLAAFLMALLAASDEGVSLAKRTTILVAAGLSIGLTARILAEF